MYFQYSNALKRSLPLHKISHVAVFGSQRQNALGVSLNLFRNSPQCLVHALLQSCPLLMVTKYYFILLERAQMCFKIYIHN